MIASTDTKKKIESVEDLLSRSLTEQQDLSAVEQYAQQHERGHIPAQSKYYRDLMPATAPQPGQQYAFEVDLDRCTSCKACVVACHNLNGLEENETWRSTGLLIGGTPEDPFQQTVTTACHHCVDPACMNGCPVNAYEKDAVTGIVKHLDDQCIGCKYCTLTCPYDVPTYSKSKGIVRKCDMCTDRLSSGEAPACVQACPNGAIRIRTVDIEEIVERSEARSFLPGAPAPDLTLPTTSYKTDRVLPPNILPADYHRVRTEDGHIPLVVMLVLTQLSTGTFFWDFLLRVFWDGTISAYGKPFYSAGALCLGVLALAASTLHLGRPHYAYRAFLGLRKSWLSREIIAFGLYAGAAALYSATFWVDSFAPWIPKAIAAWAGTASVQRIAFAGVLISGVLGVFCSVMVYVAARRPLWSGPATGFRFFGTSLMLGLSLTLCVSMLSIVADDANQLRPFLSDSGHSMCRLIIGLTLAKLIHELAIFLHLRDTLYSPLRRAAALMKGTLRATTMFRFLFALTGGVIVPGLFVMAGRADSPIHMEPSSLAMFSLLGFLALVVGELLERYLFFAASVTSRMPGGPAA